LTTAFQERATATAGLTLPTRQKRGGCSPELGRTSHLPRLQGTPPARPRWVTRRLVTPSTGGVIVAGSPRSWRERRLTAPTRSRCATCPHRTFGQRSTRPRGVY